MFDKLMILTVTPNNSDAISDILNDDRFQGAISSIDKVTSFVDQYFIMFISLVSFFIISAALLRNVIAGAYAAFPKFWDTVAEVKETVASYGDGMNGAAGKGVSIFAQIIAFFIPNLKAMSDFHDNTVEPKHYFMRAIPQMILVVMIGIVIYNGYYRDAVVLAGTFGSEIINRVILNTKPEEVLNKIMMTSGRPDFTYESVNTDRAKLIDSISKEVYGTIVTSNPDINRPEHKSDLVKSIEDWVVGFVDTEVNDRSNKDTHKIKWAVSRVSQEPNLDMLSESNTTLVTTVGASKLITELAPQTKQHLDTPWHVRVIVRTEEIPEKNSSSGTMQSVALSHNAIQKGQGKTVIPMDVSSLRAQTTGFKIGGHQARLTSSGIEVAGELEAGKSYAVTGLSYVDPVNNSQFHKIKTIAAGSSLPANTFSQGDKTWKVGDTPNKPKGDGKEAPMDGN